MPSKLLLGIIAEDESDVDSVLILAKRILGEKNISKKHFIGDGCGKIRIKCSGWAKNLNAQGCNCIIVIHDADRYNISAIRKQLEHALDDCGIQQRKVVIPIEEIEAWFLADTESIKRSST